MKKLFIPLLILSTFSFTGCDDEDLPKGCRPGNANDLALQQGLTSSKAGSREITLTPSTVRGLVLDQNIPVMLAANRVHVAKEEVNVARARLLPSINLGALAGGSAGFLTAGVEFLLPFLIPSNWFDLNHSMDLLHASHAAFRAMQLDAFSSAYSLYFQALSDTKLIALLQSQLNDFREIEAYTEELANAGAGTLDNYTLAKSQADIAEVNVLQIKDLIAQENAALKRALGLNYTQKLSLSAAEISASPWEDASIAATLNNALAKAPEATQLAYLARAAKSARWSKIFGFVKGSAAKGGSEIFSNMTVNSSFSFGFTMFPEIKITQHQAREVELRQAELRAQLQELLETNRDQIRNAKEKISLASQSEAGMQKVYDNALARFKAGTLALTEVITARGRLIQAAGETQRARVHLTLLRVALHRAMLTDQFANVPGCTAPLPKKI